MFSNSCQNSPLLALPKFTLLAVPCLCWNLSLCSLMLSDAAACCQLCCNAANDSEGLGWSAQSCVLGAFICTVFLHDSTIQLSRTQETIVHKHVFIYLGMKVLGAVFELGVDVLGWVVVLVLGAGWGVLGCLTACPDITWVALEGRLLDRGRICNTKQTNT